MTEENYRWPKKGDNPFIVNSFDPHSPTWASLEWLARWDIDDSLVADAFKDAADKIIKQLSTGDDPRHGEMFFMPIAYLYRHGLELRMKQILRLAIGLELLEKDEKLSAVLKGHNLHKIWNQMRKAVVRYWPESPGKDLRAAERIIQLFHNIDNTGQNLRYSEDSSGEKSVELFPKAVDLVHFQEVFEGLFNLLDGCEAAFDDALRTLNSLRSEFY